MQSSKFRERCQATILILSVKGRELFMKKKTFEHDVKKITEEGLSQKIIESPLVKYRVGLPYLPTMELEARSESEAIEDYNRFVGVIKTSNKYDIVKL
jgi:hypothetical protein